MPISIMVENLSTLELNEDVNQSVVHDLTTSWTELKQCAVFRQTGEWRRLQTSVLNATISALDSIARLLNVPLNHEHRTELLAQLLKKEPHFLEHPSNYADEFTYWWDIESTEQTTPNLERLTLFLQNTQSFVDTVERLHLHIKRRIYNTSDPEKEHRWMLIRSLILSGIFLFLVGLTLSNNWGTFKHFIARLFHV